MMKCAGDVVRYIVVCLLTTVSVAWADTFCSYNQTRVIFGFTFVTTKTERCDGECCDTEDDRCCENSDNAGLVAAGIVGGVLFLCLLLLVITLVCKAKNAKRNRTGTSQNITVAPLHHVHRHYNHRADHRATMPHPPQHRAAIPQPPPYTITQRDRGFSPPPAYPGTPAPVTNTSGTNTNNARGVSQTDISNTNKPSSPPPAYFE